MYTIIFYVEQYPAGEIVQKKINNKKAKEKAKASKEYKELLSKERAASVLYNCFN